MVESSTTSITPATHADRHSVGGDDPLVNPLLLHATRHETGGDDEVNVEPFTTKSDVTGSRAVDGTVYRNTSGKVMLITVSLDFQFGNNKYGAVVKTDSATPPTEIVADISHTAAGAGNVYRPVTFIVFDDDYYLVDGTLEANNAVLRRWVEWT